MSISSILLLLTTSSQFSSEDKEEQLEDSVIKNIRKKIFQQIKIAEKRYENASILMDGRASADAIPILYKAVDIAVSVLLDFKQKPLVDFQKNINSLGEEYKEEGIIDEKTLKIFHVTTSSSIKGVRTQFIPRWNTRVYELGLMVWQAPGGLPHHSPTDINYLPPPPSPQPLWTV